MYRNPSLDNIILDELLKFDTIIVGKEDLTTKASKWWNFYKKVQNFDDTQHKLGKALQKLIDRKKLDMIKKKI